MLVGGVIDLFTNGLDSASAVQSFMLAYSMGLMGLLCLPSVWTAFQRLRNKTGTAPAEVTSLWSRVFPTRPGWDAFRTVTMTLIVVLPLTLALGHLASQSGELAWLLLPPLNLLATGLPVLWLALLGMRGLNGGSPQRRWGVLAAAVSVGPLFILLLELVLLFVGLVIAGVYLSSQPGLLRQLQELLSQFRTIPPPDQEQMLHMLEPYLKTPGVMLAVFLMFAVFAPLIEELFKPIGVWLLAGKKITPAQGFVAGLLSGAGFALFENLGNTSGAGSQWALVILSRIPAALLHMLTSGLVGWALASAWTSRRYVKLALTFALAVAIHGLWNGLAVLGAVAIPFDQPLDLTAQLPPAGIAMVGGLVALAVFNFLLYVSLNRTLRRKEVPPASELAVQPSLPTQPLRPAAPEPTWLDLPDESNIADTSEIPAASNPTLSSEPPLANEPEPDNE